MFVVTCNQCGAKVWIDKDGDVRDSNILLTADYDGNIRVECDCGNKVG